VTPERIAWRDRILALYPCTDALEWLATVPMAQGGGE
jgi:hypothetical protein